MTISNLIRWIDSHDRPEATIDNGDCTLTVASVLVSSAGEIRIDRQVIPATLDSARHLLGY